MLYILGSKLSFRRIKAVTLEETVVSGIIRSGRITHENVVNETATKLEL